MKKTMKKLTHINHTKKLRALISVAVIAVVGLATVGTLVHAATGAEAYLAPSGGTYTVGDNVAIQIRENGNGAAVNSVQLGIKYPANLLQFTTMDTSGGVFTSNFSPGTQNSGEVIATFLDATGSFTSDELIATLHFTALAAGTAPLTFTGSCQSAITSDCSDLGAAGTSINTALTGGTYTIQAAATTTTTPPPVNTTTGGGTGTTSTNTSTTSTSSAGGTTSTNKTSTSITPDSSSSSITAPDNSEVQVTTPATVEPATIQPDGVKKINYYLNNKLVYSATDVPFAYHFDTNHLLNGTYTLKTVSYYDSGRTATSTQRLIVSNPFSFTQFGLLIGHYAWFIIPLLIILIILLIAWLTRKRWNDWFNRPRFTSPTSTTPTNLQGPPSIITPSGSALGSTLSPQTIPIRTDDGE